MATEPGMRNRFALAVGLIPLALVFAAHSTSRSQSPPPHIQRFVEGVDSAVTAMAASDIAAQLNDPWGALVLRKGVFPASLDEALVAIDQASQGGAGLPLQSSFVVSESGKIPVNAASANLQREF